MEEPNDSDASKFRPKLRASDCCKIAMVSGSMSDNHAPSEAPNVSTLMTAVARKIIDQATPDLGRTNKSATKLKAQTDRNHCNLHKTNTEHHKRGNSPSKHPQLPQHRQIIMLIPPSQAGSRGYSHARMRRRRGAPRSRPRAAAGLRARTAVDEIDVPPYQGCC